MNGMENHHMEDTPCMDPTAGELLWLVLMGVATEEEIQRFDEHCFQCDACTEQVGQSLPYFEARRQLQAERAAGFAAQPISTAPGERRPFRFRGLSMFTAYRPPIFAAAAAVLLMMVLLPMYWSPTPAGAPPNWAVIEEPGLPAASHRGNMTEEELVQAVTPYRENAPAWLELGYLRAFRGDTDGAILALQTAATVEAGALADPARWLLANVYLKHNRLQEAQNELAAVVAGGGAHKDRAQRLLKNIQAYQKRPGASS